ncbi:MAG: 16S rRNA (adenine(1518)-N(6)/adenine(1519)-N(6))-dimethyltransferase RsmA [Actinomycetota bacterium]|nr:16S rRNA (adenine(1518)-N(6)/adenine(1519)-N(6))-dimethyltransferase RsmA [Actinomycetota bacterium]
MTPPSASAGPRLLGPADVRLLADRLGIRPTKQRGQNFVIDPNTVRRIVSVAGVSSGEQVLEVGPGFGSLTLGLLAAGARVTAVEIDHTLAAGLRETVVEYAPEQADSLTVVDGDALRVELAGDPTALVANLPYNVAVPVLLHLLETQPTLRRALVMVQLEVAERLAAGPGSKVYGVPSVKAAWYCAVRKAGHIGRTVFWPVPNVDSALVLMERRDPPTTAVGRERVFQVIDAAFGQRRKMVRSSLAGLAPAGAAERALLAAGIDPTARAERLTVAEFSRIADSLAVAP